ncbi:MAG: AAA family ATPase [Oscillospiraceae bacterium]
MNNQEIFSIAQREHVVGRVRELSKRSDDIKCRIAQTLKQLWSPERPLSGINNLELFKSLRSRFPNFNEVIDILEANAIGLHKLELPFESSPILMLGDPGLGKTYFASEFSRLSTLPYYEINMATTTSSFGLSGGNLQWSEGTVGFVASALASSHVANPIFLIDEIDKAFGSNRYSPLAPFYSLLERHSAQKFKDEALEIEIDASRVIWMATANYVDYIPDPILSRMRVVNIPKPNEIQMREIICSIYANFRVDRAYGKLFDEQINDDVVDLLVHMAPREARLAIEEASLKAICDQRFTFLPKDILIKKKEKQNVGFI